MGIRDVDWFNADPTYRGQAGAAQTNLYDQLSQIMYDRGQRYRELDNRRDDWNTNRNYSGQQTAENMASRGLLRSGVYRQGVDRVLNDYEKAASAINSEEQDTINQYGARNSMANQTFTQDALTDKNYTALASIYGLLGSKGVSAGNAYNAQLGQYRGASAGRSDQKIQNTLGW